MVQKKQTKVRDERVVAKHQLVALLRSNQTVFRALQVPRNAADEALIQALAKFDSSFDTLRACGYNIAEAARAGDLLPLALEAPAKTSKRKTQTNGEYTGLLKVVAALLSLTLLSMVGVLVWTLLTATSGWLVGSCSMTIFANQTCNQGPGRCAVEVMVKGQGAWVVKKDWSLPVAYTSNVGGVPLTRYHSDALRCCNTQVQGKDALVGTCCSLWDTETQQFCDNWVGRRDHYGKPCPRENWKCVYKLDEVDKSLVTEVVPYVAPDLTPMIAIIATTASLLLSGLVVFLLHRAGVEMNCCSKRKLPRRLKHMFKSEDELSTSDEDEPGDFPRMETASKKDEQNQKRAGASMSGPLSALYTEENQSDQAASEKRSRRKSSTLSGSSDSQLSESTASSKQRGSAWEHRRLNDPAGLPGVVEVDEAATEAESLADRQEDERSADNYTKYLSWESLDKNRNELGEDDIHTSFKQGDLSQLAAMAERAIQEHAVGLIEPLGGRTASRQGYGHPQRNRHARTRTHSEPVGFEKQRWASKSSGPQSRNSSKKRSSSSRTASRPSNFLS